MGPLVSKEQQERVRAVHRPRYQGGEARDAGDTPGDVRLANGYFVPPTVFADVDNHATIAREEIFGP